MIEYDLCQRLVIGICFLLILDMQYILLNVMVSEDHLVLIWIQIYSSYLPNNILIMEPIDVYLMYCAMKAHFSKNDYDFFTYKGKSRVPRNSFYKRKDRIFFVKLSKKYEEYEDIKNYLVANFIVEKQGYVANFNDENYETWKEKRNNFYDIFTEEIRPFVKNFNQIFEVKNSEHPLILKEYLGKRVSLETLIILDELVGLTKTWNRRMAEDYIWYDLKKLMKNYKRFLTIDKNQYRIQLLKLIEESSDE